MLTCITKLIIINLMESQGRQILRDDFIKKLSNYSRCIQPYLRNIQDKYATSYYAVEHDPVDIKAYCTREYEETI